LKINSTLADFERLAVFLRSCGSSCLIGFEATGDYHRPLAHFLHRQGFNLSLVSSIAVARTREARYNSWDKNDPKDCQVILHLLQTGTTQIYNDPLVNNYNDLQEMANTYQRVALRKVQLHHTIFTHYLPLYFPEAERYCHSSRAEWFTRLLLLTPCPAAVLAHSKQEFIDKAGKISGRKVDKLRWLSDFYEAALSSIALPVATDSEAIRMFRVVLEEYFGLCQLRQRLEAQVRERLADHTDFKRLQTIPGIGPILAMTILAESGDLRRFSHHRKFLKYCGLDLCTTQSGQFRGQPKLSKRGNARLRYAFWMAGTIAVRMQQNGFRRKYEDYIRRDPKNADLKRKAYTAVAAKMARVVYGVIKSETDYRRFQDAAVPGGRIHSHGP
jgi:transposase